MFRIKSNMQDGTFHKNSLRLKTNDTSRKSPTSDVRPNSEHTTEYNLSSEQILKVRKNIKFQVESWRLSSKNHHRNTNFVTTLWSLFRIESDIWDGAPYKSSPQLKTNGIWANRPTPDIWSGSEQTSDHRSKFRSNIENQEEELNF